MIKLDTDLTSDTVCAFHMLKRFFRCADNIKDVIYTGNDFPVQVFDPGDRFVRMFGQHGDRPGNFAHPCGIATDQAGNIYVTDRQFENVQIFDAQGRILMALGQEGNGPGKFWLPAGLFIDGRGRLYVADSFNKRIQIFELLKEAEP